MKDYIGNTIGNRYEIMEKIGEGGMAIVYKARCRVLNRLVAIKILKDEFMNDGDFIDKFKNEALSAGALNQQNIISIYDVSEENKVPYIVMEYVDGENIKEIIQKRGKLDKETMLNYAKQIAMALKEAHRHKIVHRDIKSQNIMVSKNGTIKVTDFGIAKAVSSSTITAVGSIMGSVHYFSPEQARGGYIDERSDIYSLGIVMYEMITGKLPFEGDSPVSIALKHIQEQIVFDDDDENPSEIKDIIRKATQKTSDRRYKTIDDFIDDIEYVQTSKTLILGMGFQDETYKEQILEDDIANTIQFLDVAEQERLRPRRRKNKNKTSVFVYVLAILLALIISVMLVFGYYYFNGFKIKAKTVSTPNLIGTTLEEAQKIVQENGMKITVVSEEINSKYEVGEISKQEPLEGTKIEEGTEIKITIVKKDESIILSKFVEMDIEEAKRQLDEMEIEYIIEYKSDETIEMNKIISQLPSENSTIERGEKVKLVVSSGADESQVEVPNVEGKTLDEAKKILGDAKLSSSISYRDNQNKDEGIVLSQNPKVGTKIAIDSEVSIVVNRYDKSVLKAVPIVIRLEQDRESVKVEIVDADTNQVVATQTVNPIEQNGAVSINVFGRPGEEKKYYVYLDGDRTNIYANPTVSFN